jgi:hypothetical protein
MVLSKFSVKTWSENLFGIDSVHWFRSVSDADNLVSGLMCLISDWDFTQSDSVILLNKIFIALSLVETEGVLLNKVRYEKYRRLIPFIRNLPTSLDRLFFILSFLYQFGKIFQKLGKKTWYLNQYLLIPIPSWSSKLVQADRSFTIWNSRFQFTISVLESCFALLVTFLPFDAPSFRTWSVRPASVPVVP